MTVHGAVQEFFNMSQVLLRKGNKINLPLRLRGAENAVTHTDFLYHLNVLKFTQPSSS
jgi:hypothetical protein